MADQKLSQLTASGALTGAELAYVVQDGNSRRTTLAAIVALASGTNLTYDPVTRLLASSTGADVTLPVFTSSLAGLVGASGGGTTNFLRADGTWAAPPASAGTDLSYDAATRLLASSTGADVTLPLATDALDGLQSAAHRALVQALIAAGVTAAGSTVTIPHIHGDIAGSLYIHVKNLAGVQLTKGTPVRVVGAVGDTSTLEVAAADASSAGTMPAIGILGDTLAVNGTGHAVVAGELLGMATGGYSVGQAVYVASGGGLTATKPTSGTIQQVAIVGRVNASTGSITVTIAGMQSPNWDTAYSERLRWDGGATGLDAATGRASLGLGSAAQGTIGTAAGNVVALDGSARLPAVDGSQLTGLPAAPVTSVAGRTGAVTLAVGDVANAVATNDARLSDARTPLAHTQEWGTITGTPTTLSGYGITDAFNPASPGAIGGATPAAGTFTRLTLPAQGSAPSTPASGFTLYSGSGNALSWVGANGFTRTLDGTANTANLTWLLPNQPGTLALASGLGTNANAIARVSGTTGTTIQGSDVIIDDYTAATLGNIQISARSAVFSCTATAADDFIVAAGHTFANGDQVQFSALTGGTGLSTATRYFVRDAEDGRFKVASTAGGAVVDITADATAGTVNLMIAIGLAPTLGGVFYLGPKPDGTAVGGVTRGPFSIDLQTNRTLSGQVASGFSSAILGGSGNSATGNTSVVLGGSGNTASGTRSCASGFQAVASRINTFAWSGGGFSTAGDCQMLFAVMRNRTTNATPTEVFLEGTATRLTVPSGRILAGAIDCIGTRSDGLSVARYRRAFAIKNVSGTTSLVGSVQTVGTDHEDNASTDIAIDADDTNDALRIRVTGIAGETWRWMARVDWSEIAWGT